MFCAALIVKNYFEKRTFKWVSCGDACSPHLPEVSRHYRVVVKCFASGQHAAGLIPGARSWSRRLQSSKGVTLTGYSHITHSVWVRAAAPPLCSILLLHTPVKHLTHDQPAQSTTLSNLDAWGQPCGGACTLHLPEVSCHYRVVVKCISTISPFLTKNIV